MRTTIAAIEGEYHRYKALADAAIAQLEERELSVSVYEGGNSIATICWHVAGNLRSRFTDFLATDGEKPWRDREEEFAPRHVTRDELVIHWERGWSTLFGALDALLDADLTRTITIRKQPLSVQEALLRSLAHASYHVGQIIFAARAQRGSAWRFLSIPPGKSNEYNAAPRSEKPTAHAEVLRQSGDHSGR